MWDISSTAPRSFNSTSTYPNGEWMSTAWNSLLLNNTLMYSSTSREKHAALRAGKLIKTSTDASWKHVRSRARFAKLPNSNATDSKCSPMMALNCECSSLEPRTHSDSQIHTPPLKLVGAWFSLYIRAPFQGTHPPCTDSLLKTRSMRPSPCTHHLDLPIPTRRTTSSDAESE